MNYILGKSGTIGFSLSSKLPENSIKEINKSEYLKWISEEEIEKYFTHNAISAEDRIFVCSGLTNPYLPTRNLLTSNFEIPRNILKAAAKNHTTVITFGSIFENLDSNNPYIISKKKYLEFLNNSTSLNNYFHFQLHTLYGGQKLSQHMFLGQVFESLVKKEVFNMSSGRQLREYWHVEDVTKLVLDVLKVNQKFGIIKISSGVPFELRQLAKRIFKYFEVSKLLKLGVHPDFLDDNFESFFQSEIENIHHWMRDPFEGVISYLGQQLRVETK
jgi:nucleoside-diphosphate-sugar epimerase